MVERLISAKADVNITNSYGMRPIDVRPLEAYESANGIHEILLWRQHHPRSKVYERTSSMR